MRLTRKNDVTPKRIPYFWTTLWSGTFSKTNPHVLLIFAFFRIEKLRATSNSLPGLLFFPLVRHLPRCQIGVLAGLLSTSHFKLTDIPSTIGIPKPGKRVIANDGVSETGIKQLVSVPTSMPSVVSKISGQHRESYADIIWASRT